MITMMWNVGCGVLYTGYTDYVVGHHQLLAPRCCLSGCKRSVAHCSTSVRDTVMGRLCQSLIIVGERRFWQYQHNYRYSRGTTKPHRGGIHRFIVSSIHRFIDSSVHRFIDSSIHRFIDSSIHRWVLGWSLIRLTGVVSVLHASFWCIWMLYFRKK